MPKFRIPERSEITDDTPLLLPVAAEVAFPDGSMSGLVLRRAAQRGELGYERLGSRVYTTLAAITAWRVACRQKTKPRSLGEAGGESPTTDDLDASQAALQLTIDSILKGAEKPTAPKAMRSRLPSRLSNKR